MRALVTEVRRLYAYRTLLQLLIDRDLKTRYRRSVLGLLWTMLNPLLTMAVMTIVFSAIFRFAVVNYPVFMLSGYIFWGFFAQSTLGAAPIIQGNGHLIKKVALPRSIFPLAVVASSLVNLLFALPALLIIMLVTGRPIQPALLFLPISLLALVLFTAGIALFLAAATVFFNDIQHLYSVLLTLLLYLTPVMYPLAIVPQRYHWILVANPLYYLIAILRQPVYYGAVPAWDSTAIGFGAGLLSLTGGLWFFTRSENSFISYV